MIGTEIGTYRIVEKIGEGGMGVVYKAIDIQLDRVVAVKALNSELSGNPELLERFRGEARAQAKLNHPNLATLYAFLVDNGAAYMAMEFVDGETFHELLARRGSIPVAEAVPLFRQALAGIGHAHRLGVVHRDIKPSNIMVNREGVVKVMDFGLAKAAGDLRVTRSGVRLGTAYYMSPEQVLVKPADARSDIYSLGVTLYELLTGQTPFRADSEFEILNDHVNTPPTPPSQLHAIPSGIEHAVLKALAKNPDQRFQSVEQFSAALERPEAFYLAATAVDAAPVAVTPVKPAFWTARRKLLAGVAAALVCLPAAWFVAQLKKPPRSQPQAQVSVPPPPPASVVPSAPPVRNPMPAPVRPAVKPVPLAKKIAVPAGTPIPIVTVDPIDYESSSLGDEFKAKLSAAVTADGRVVFRADDQANLRLEEMASSGKSKKHELMLQLVSITSGRTSYGVRSAPFPIKSGIWHKKRVSPGTSITFELSEQVEVTPPS